MAGTAESVVGTSEVQENLGRLLDRVSQGETITITRQGVPVAKLTPPTPAADDLAARQAAIEEWIELRKGIQKPEGMTIKEMIEEGRQ
jgi:prevent-host-death family protein